MTNNAAMTIDAKADTTTTDTSEVPGQGLSPMLIGLTGSVIAMAILAPMAINGNLIAAALLIPMLIVCTGIYTWSVLCPGPVTSLKIDTNARSMEVVQANAFAEKRRTISFDDIADIAQASDDKPAIAMTLKDGEVISMPPDLAHASMAEVARNLKPAS
ncbi:MAG: hypothetical protein ACK5JT_12955 [Hyphomicrobiaceae bacterium]